MSTSTTLHAESLIRNTGARVTTTRVKVLDFLLGQSASLTHHEIQHSLSGDGEIDSVTLYRVLEWLSENELVHRIAGADQVWRFGAGGGHHSHEHAHFQCTKCATLTCFTEVKLPAAPALPDGFRGQEMDFLIKGLCPRCG
ncbi:Fur family transcriptional regulator [Janthinobacterium fluminis]|uniref:Transcriptional repressor n=1 Tax=Janthinobacterium fluminis TaxID=2987524 RepID=A0ABT5JVX8_9BURK|nr:transcriptional repressor [Janthinobacterium fluminis]MDC8756890.1 transcriptional repressor [Janthinobacterium fluminis]